MRSCDPIACIRDGADNSETGESEFLCLAIAFHCVQATETKYMAFTSEHGLFPVIQVVGRLFFFAVTNKPDCVQHRRIVCSKQVYIRITEPTNEYEFDFVPCATAKLAPFPNTDSITVAPAIDFVSVIDEICSVNTVNFKFTGAVQTTPNLIRVGMGTSEHQCHQCRN